VICGARVWGALRINDREADREFANRGNTPMTNLNNRIEAAL
jgi:hypothetical protein